MRRTRLCLEGWFYLILVAFIFCGAMIREINLLLFVAGIMLGPLILSWRILVRFFSKLTVARSLPYGVGAGEIFPVRLTVTNGHKRWGAWGLSIESKVRRLNEDADPTSTFAFVPFVGQRDQIRQSFDCRIHDRGAYEFGKLGVTSRFPMGLIRRTVVMGEPQVVYVYPRLGRLRRKWIESTKPTNIGSQRSQHRPGFTEGEFHSLRDWRNSDSRRWIHWRTTARRNQLTVRQFERRQNRNLAIVLELRDDEKSNVEIERMIRFAATAVASHCRTGSSQLLLAIAGERSEIASGLSSAGLMRDCLELLATAQPSKDDHLPETLDQALSQLDTQTRIVVISTNPVDLSDTTRFAKTWEQPNKRSLLSRIAFLDASEGKLSELFDEDERINASEQRTETAGPDAADGTTYDTLAMANGDEE